MDLKNESKPNSLKTITESLKNFNWYEYLTLQKIVYQFITGFLSCVLGVSLINVLGAHLAWELFTNWDQGRAFLVKYLNRDFSDDKWETSLADNILFASGWLVANSICGKGSLQEQIVLKFK